MRSGSREDAAYDAGEHVFAIVRQEREAYVDEKSHLEKTKYQRLPPRARDTESPAAAGAQEKGEQKEEKQKRADEGKGRSALSDGSHYAIQRKRGEDRKRNICHHDRGDDFAPPRDKRPKQSTRKQSEYDAQISRGMRQRGGSRSRERGCE